MRTTKALLAGLLVVGLAASAHAATIYQESFDYGDSTGLIRDGLAGNWDTSSGVLYYDHDGGLTHGALGGEKGGAFHHDYDSGNRSISNDVDPVFDPFPTMSQGDVMWFAGLIQLANHDETTNVVFQNSEAVNSIGFGVDSGGNVIAIASADGATAQDRDTGVDAAADGSTYLFLIRGTKGSGSSPTDSEVEFWFDPIDASSVAALGAPDWVASEVPGDGEVKWGRESGSYTGAVVNASFQSRADELRIGDTLADVGGVPEPATLALMGLGLGGMLLKRRRS